MTSQQFQSNKSNVWQDSSDAQMDKGDNQESQDKCGIDGHRGINEGKKQAVAAGFVGIDQQALEEDAEYGILNKDVLDGNIK